MVQSLYRTARAIRLRSIIMVGLQGKDDEGDFGEINQEQVSETKLRALRQANTATSVPTTATPVQQHRTSNDMDINFARRGPLSFSDRQQRFSQEPYLVCGQSGHLKAFCPRSNSSSDPNAISKPLNGTLAT
ncbi:hypothetical protein BASA83_006615 [Batrachochytrium salamandrivorans]|nr:hypothetical protein BASA83_006615 [Batrachochytrium salamandrivorans]